MNAQGPQPSRRNWGDPSPARICAALALSAAACWSCSSPRAASAHDATDVGKADAPLVAAEPGAWFDAYGNLTIVGAGKRLRLVLSAPISVCGPALERSGEAADVVAAASLPFHVLSDACREAHPAILLADESDTASPAELEHSYHEVARCAAADFGLSEAWVPKLIAESDPCPLALGLGWRLPRSDELNGLTVDDRKALAGALFDPGDRSAFGDLLLYARAPGGVDLVTLSPNAAEQPPSLDEEKRARPLLGAALRCVNDSSAARASSRGAPPVLPHATACLREQRLAQGALTTPRSVQPVSEVHKLKIWLDAVERFPASARDKTQLAELSTLLASPALERVARDAREERALTERYAELAEGLDDPSVSQAERQRRRAEFDHLRKRLSGQIVQSTETAGADRTTLAALLPQLQLVLERAAQTKAKLPHKTRVDFALLRARVAALTGKTGP